MYKITKKSIENSQYIISIYSDNKLEGFCKFIIKDDMFDTWNIMYDITDEISSKSIHITSIVSNTKNIGVGSMLIGEIESIAKIEKINYVTLSSILSSVGFWNKMNFKYYGFGEFYYMYKKIN